MKRSLLALVSALILTPSAYAGFVEVGASGTYRKSNVSDYFSESYSVTGSLSYLFDEMSAIELSYTEGFGKTFIGATTAGATKEFTQHVVMTSLDFVFTFGDRESVIRPYIKAGAGYILQKEITEDIQGFGPRTVSEPTGIVPSGGLGFRIAITKSLSVKAGIDGWSSQPIGKEERNSKIDYAGRAGISWMF